MALSELTNPNAVMEIIRQVLDLQQSWMKDNTPEMNLRGRLIRDVGPEVLKTLMPAPSTLSFTPSIEGRDGVGAKTRVPWIRIFDKKRSPSATSGWYVVFLFAADGQAVFLSLNQGTTITEHGKFRKRPKLSLLEQAERARSLFTLAPNNRLRVNIELQDPKGFGEQYEYGNVVGFRYARDELPDELLLKADLEVILEMLSKLYEVEGNERVEYPVDLPLQADVSGAVLQPHKLSAFRGVYDTSQAGISEEVIQPKDEESFAIKASTIRCRMDDFNTLLMTFHDFIRASRLEVDLTTSVDVLASVLSSQFLLFAGPSGTGKSRLARVLARFFTTDDAWHTLEARRQWIGPEDAFGYYSPLTGHYVLTPSTIELIDLHLASLRWLSSATGSDSIDVAVPILLIEEANLSPIEGYLAPIMHGISSPATPYLKVQLHAKHSGATDSEDFLTIPCDILLGPFPRFFGTINVDPTSQAPARKISARANVILLEPEEQFDPLAAATFLSNIGTIDTTDETKPPAGPGRPWIGDPSSARTGCTQSELREITNALAFILKRIADAGSEASVHISHRDLERCVNYMAYFVRLGEAAASLSLDRTTLLALAAENALLHVVLPNLPAHSFRACVTALLIDKILCTPSASPDQLGGLLLSRMRRLHASATGLVFAEALDFWACLS